MQAVRSALIWTAEVTLILLWLPILAVSRLFDEPPYYRTGYLFRRLGYFMTKVNPAWDIQVEGAFPENPRLPYVVVSNHQSNADIPVVSNLPWEMKWVGKKELFDLPVVGWMMKLAADLPVDRKDPQSRSSVLKRAKAVLHQKCSVIFFAEGTRSKDGRLRPFKDGAFRLAIDAGVPILPVALDGTSDTLPKHGWKFGPPVQVYLKVLDPIPTDGLTVADVAALRERTRQAIAQQIAGWRGVPVEEVQQPLPSRLTDGVREVGPLVDERTPKASEKV